MASIWYLLPVIHYEELEMSRWERSSKDDLDLHESRQQAHRYIIIWRYGTRKDVRRLWPLRVSLSLASETQEICNRPRMKLMLIYSARRSAHVCILVTFEPNERTCSNGLIACLTWTNNDSTTMSCSCWLHVHTKNFIKCLCTGYIHVPSLLSHALSYCYVLLRISMHAQCTY